MLALNRSVVDSFMNEQENQQKFPVLYNIFDIGIEAGTNGKLLFVASIESENRDKEGVTYFIGEAHGETFAGLKENIIVTVLDDLSDYDNIEYNESDYRKRLSEDIDTSVMPVFTDAGLAI